MTVLSRLRRRKAGAYGIQSAPGLQGEYTRGADQVAWHHQSDSLVYDRHRGLWLYTEEPEEAIVDTGQRRDVLARSPRADLPLASELAGTELAELLTATDWTGGNGDRWSPAVTIHCIATDPSVGTTTVWWHREDEWSFVEGDGLTKLRITTFDANGVTLGEIAETLWVGGAGWWLGRICAEVHQGFIYALEPTGFATGWTTWPTWDQQWIAFRLVKRQASSLALASTPHIFSADGEGADSITVDRTVARAWVFTNRAWLSGSGPHPTYDDLLSYHATYVAEVDTDAMTVGASSQLTFGFGDANPWSLDEAQPYGDAVCWDGGETFVSIGFDPATWDDPPGINSLWRFNLAAGGTRLGGTSTPFLVDGYGRRLDKVGEGEYLVYRGDQHGVTGAALVSLA